MKNYKNNYYTTTRSNHYCKYCDGFIPKGSEVRTINPKYEGRFWVCSDCDSLIKNIISTINRSHALPFDDEGGYMAETDYLAELMDEAYNRFTDRDIIEQLEDFTKGDE